MIVYHARWVVPVSSPPVRDGAVAVDEAGRIAFVGRGAAAPAGERRDLGPAILLPGLVNAHTHLELTVLRGFLEGLPFFEWISTLTRARREALDTDDLRASARVGILEGLAAGITTYADTSESGVTLSAMRELGVRGTMFLEVFGPDPARCDDALDALREKLRVHREDESDLTRLGVSPHAPYSVSADLFRAVGDLAIAARLPVAIHLAEGREETAFVKAGAGPWAESHRRRGIPVLARGQSPVAYLAATGVLQARPLLIHCVEVNVADIAAIGAAGCAVAHCPVSNAKLGHGVAPVTEMRDAGITMGLGSDSMASNNRMHLLEEARAAILAQRVRTSRADALDAAAMLELATLGGATALGIADRVGSLEVGKDADLAAFLMDEAAGMPSFDPVDTLVWSLGGARAALVTVRGVELVRDGVTLADRPADRERLRQAAQRLVGWRAG